MVLQRLVFGILFPITPRSDGHSRRFIRRQQRPALVAEALAKRIGVIQSALSRLRSLIARAHGTLQPGKRSLGGQFPHSLERLCLRARSLCDPVQQASHLLFRRLG